ncbi:peptidoglycan-binding domain-containing protein [Azospirillum sp. SYSU D00513]|uniref:peptidoglycan-binding domain-containing protein n=1 Tax=Azospirillum sp. SYSU D00513 TaxID=2812561 RepID=UPI001A96B740|nr:peptidoglycan-binding domain-containing protein [Azospirillum sp. SYSU D00513]
MSGGSNRARRVLVLPVVIGLAASGLPGTAALAQSAGDLQWAQTILKDKGYNIGGRANGQMTPQTGAALSAYQKANGLPATGKLDQATVSKMMAERQAKAAPTVGNLAQQKPGGGGPGQTPRQTREVAPRAANSTGKVEALGGQEGGGAAFSSGFPGSGAAAGGTLGTAGSAPRGAEPAPQAAPRPNVAATTASGEPVPTVEPGSSALGGGSFLPSWATGALRYVLMAVLAATVGGLGFAWWRSGRASAPVQAPVRQERREARLEPTFGGRRDELTAGPRLGGDRRR